MKEKILSIVPEAILEEKHGIWFVSVPRTSFHDLALRLRNDEDTSFDFLVCMTGMDWGETLGVMYHLRSSKYGHDLALRVETENRENPELPSVSDIWATANLNEREVFDFYGIRFINHPDMRRLFLRNDWIGYPLRKDYDADEKINPIRLESESSPDATPTLELTKEGTIEERENVIFEDDEYVVNIGPQHPATHGVLRFRVSLEGEIVKKVDVNCGYIHRGIEKMCETLTYPQTLALTDRLDYLSAHMNRHALCMCIEEAMGLEIPERAKYIRTIMDELTRIASHLLFWSTFCMDLGALTAFFYGFRDREKILDMFEETCGGRLIQNYNCIGGVMADIHPNLITRIKDFIRYLPPMLKEYHGVFTGNIIARQRMKDIGILSLEDAISYGVTGPSGRASGWKCDIRGIRIYEELPENAISVKFILTGYTIKSISKKSLTTMEIHSTATWCVWMKSSNRFTSWSSWSTIFRREISPLRPNRSSNFRKANTTKVSKPPGENSVYISKATEINSRTG